MQLFTNNTKHRQYIYHFEDLKEPDYILKVLCWDSQPFGQKIVRKARPSWENVPKIRRVSLVTRGTTLKGLERWAQSHREWPKKVLDGAGKWTWSWQRRVRMARLWQCPSLFNDVASSDCWSTASGLIGVARATNGGQEDVERRWPWLLEKRRRKKKKKRKEKGKRRKGSSWAGGGGMANWELSFLSSW